MRKILIGLALTVVMLAAIAGAVVAAKPASTIYVDDDGNCAGLKPCHRTIQRGVNAASAGGTVKVFPGSYEENVEVDEDVTVIAYDLLVLPVVNGELAGVGITVTADGATLDHIQVTNGLGGVLVLADSVAVQSLTVTANTGAGIAVLGTSTQSLSGVSVLSNTVTLNTGDGIFANWTLGLTVSGNTANGNGGYGISLDYTQNAQVTANSVGQNTLGGILFVHVDPSLIGSNTVTGNGGFGIFVSKSQDIMVEDNDVQSNGADGIGFNEVDPSFIIGNKVGGNTGTGIMVGYSQDITVEDNDVDSNGADGIGFNEVDPSYILGNNVGGNGGTGIMVSKSQEIGVENNDVQSNGADGIGFNEVDPSYISGNNVGGNTGTGIKVGFSQDITVDGNDVQSNGADGIGFNEVDPSFILDNLVSGNGGDGLDVNNSLDILARDNDINGNALGLRLHGGTGNSIFHNNFVGNTVSLIASGSPGASFHSGCPNPTGNFWSSYAGGDDGTAGSLCGERRVAGDGIGDAGTGFGGVDYYPVLQPNGWDPYNARMRLDATIHPKANEEGNKGTWVTVKILVPRDSGYHARDIEKSTLTLAGNTGTVPWDPKSPSSISEGPDGSTVLHVKFKRGAWLALVFPGDWCYAILGSFKDGQTIMAVGCVRIQ